MSLKLRPFVHIGFSLFLLFAVAGPMGAAASEAINYGERLRLDSKVLGENRTVLVSTPGSYGRSDEGYPVLFLTDGPAHFKHTVSTVEFLARAGRIPEMIVAGVANTDRNRDLTPSQASITQPDGSVTKYPTSGGADKFLEFFSSELIPFIESSYRTQPYRILAGHSFGGLFAAHALLSQPELFNAYITVSPALPWDDELVLRQAKETFSRRDHLKATLVITMGDEPRLEDSFDRFVTFLGSAKMPDFQWKSRQFADEDHRSIVLPSHYFGLREIFAGWMLPRDESTGAVVGGFEALRKHFTELSARYGYEILPSERLVDRLGHMALVAGDFESAVEIFRYNVTHHPESGRSYGRLGEALERQGDLDQALVNYKAAADLAERNGAANLDVFQRNIERLEEKVKPE